MMREKNPRPACAGWPATTGFSSSELPRRTRPAAMVSGAVASAVLACGVTTAGAGEIPLGSDGDAGSLSFGGLLQPRLEYDRRDDGDHRAEATLRRAWLDIRGELPGYGLTFRMQTDVGGSASVRDLWLQYALGDSWGLRMGQYTAPFALSRSVGGPNRTFTEIGVAANNFQIPQGRDTGLGLLGGVGDGRWEASINVFDGRGRLDSRGDRPSTDGGLVTARAAYAPVGAVPSHTSTLGNTRQPAALSFGVGGMAAADNHLRDWTLGDNDDVPADWATGTVDVAASLGPVTGTAAAFQRRVSPDEGSGYDDQGWEAELAVALPVVDQEVALRRSVLRRDVNDDRPDASERGGQREWSAGWTAFHDGHAWKTQVFAVRTRGGDQPSDWQAHVQHQLRF
ncbi:porin [Aquisalimonas asiatica]|nr:porin [Aquisalimonas asiatica]